MALIASLLFATTSSAQDPPPEILPSEGRKTIDFDENWRFAKGEHSDAENPEFDASDWQQVDVPHDWAIAGPFDEDAPASGEGGFLPTGVGWYRKKFTLPKEAETKRVFIELDGVMANSDVWINGQHLGHRPYGYVSLRYELTDYLEHGEANPNVIAVRADTSKQIASRWYTGTGIYRHVRLVFVKPLHVDYCGVFVTTPSVESEKATVNVEITLRNQNDSGNECEVRTRILGAEGNQVAESSTDAQVDSDTRTTVKLSAAVENPELWDIDNPALYQAETEVLVDGQSMDKLTTTFGIREIEFRADTGFWLNGRNLKIKGVCLHHAGGAFGAAVPRSVWEERLRRLRELGVNGIRTAHNPPDPVFLDVCDRMGFVVMDEFFDCWTVGKREYDYHRHFDEWAHRDARETILRDRNHPSIVLYSVGNEIRDTPKEEHAKRILKGLVELCHDTDPSRPVTQGLFRPNVSHDYDNGLADMLDVIGTNYRDQELLQAWRDDPSRKIIGTEQSHERRTWLACRNNPQHAGQFLWVGIDYLGESRRWPVTTFNSGLLDRTGYLHPRGYERQSWWSEAPMVHLFRRVAQNDAVPIDPGYEVVEWRRRQVLFSDWNPQNTESHEENVEVYSNCEEVELLLNGKSLGTKPLSDDARPRNWEVDFQPGTLLAIGRNGGEEVTRHELRTAGEPARLELTTTRRSLPADWDEIAWIEATVVDEDGVRVPRANNEIAFEVEGPGEVAAVDNGSIVSHEPFQATSRKAFQGRCVAFVRATGDDDKIRVTATSPTLESDEIQLSATKRKGYTQ